MLALGSYKETLSNEENFSVFGFNKDEVQFIEGENKFCISFDTLLKATDPNQSKNQDAKKKDITRMDMLNPPSPGIIQIIKNNFMRVSYLCLSFGVFIGIGNLSKKYC